MKDVVYTSRIRINHQSTWVHRGDVEGLREPIFMGKHGPLKERFMARYPHRPPVRETEEYPTSQDYLTFAVGG